MKNRSTPQQRLNHFQQENAIKINQVVAVQLALHYGAT